MIHLKKIYEAFNSHILSQTMKFVNKSSRKSFSEEINNIAKTIDYPISNLSDELFQYLPFKKALYLNSVESDIPCDATSKMAFPDYAVDDEVCDGGMIKRKWGRQIRKVTCPICKGTGVKPDNTSKIKWLKFWFSKDGEFICSTLTDNIIRQSPQLKKSSLELDDYDIDRQIDVSELRTIPVGTIVKLKTSRYNHYHVAIIYRSNTGQTYAIQNHSDGGYDSYSNEWRKYGRYSWAVPNSDTYNPVFILKPKHESEKEIDEIDPYDWNAPIVYSRYGGIQTYGRSIKPDDIKDAHFALVVDFEELKKSKYTKRSITKQNREDSRKDALSLKSDSDIRRENINKYIAKLSSNIKIDDELTNFNKLFLRILGWTNCGWYVLLGYGKGSINDIITYMCSYMKLESDSNKQYYSELIKNIISDKTKENTVRNEEVTVGLQRAYKYFQKSDSDKDKQILEILDIYYDINRAIYDLIKSIKTETIEDLEVFYSKIDTLYHMFYNHSRYREARRIRYFLSYINREDNYNMLIGDVYNPEETIRELKMILNFIKKY